MNMRDLVYSAAIARQSAFEGSYPDLRAMSLTAPDRHVRKAPSESDADFDIVEEIIVNAEHAALIRGEIKRKARAA